MDRITNSFVDQFREEQSLPNDLSQSDLFELFTIYSVVSNAYEDEFDATELMVGGGNDLGIDGVATIVNGVLVTSIDEAEDLLSINGFLDVKFIFIQAKTTSSFDGQSMVALLDGVEEFFSDPSVRPVNESIKAAREIMTWLYTKSVKFTRQKPTLEMYYVTTGRWQNDANLTALVEQRVKRHQDTQLFGAVLFFPYGANEIQAAYQRSKNNVTVEFNFVNKVTLPEIDGVSVAYLGVLPASEYISLLTDPAGNIRKPLFYDNVRDFLGANDVNRDIRETLGNATGQQRFAVLNNGVTVVTRGLRTTGNRFAISDYQIVNGCQTSYVLFDAKDGLGPETNVPIKVVATTDEDIISSIITSTNRQTQVTTEDLLAKSAFQKRLESLYDAYPGKKKLYYERRSRQYATVNNIEKVRIIDKKTQIRAFAAMFLDDPHRAARYYSDLMSQVSKNIFNDTHKLEPYYVSAYAYYKLEFLFRNSQIPVYYKPARYQILMAVRYLTGGSDMPALTANKMTQYANKIAEALWSDQGAVDAFKQAVELVDSVLGEQALTRDTVKTQSFTDAIKAAAKAQARQTSGNVTAE